MVRLAYALFASAVASVSIGAPTASTAARSASYTGAPLGRRIASPRVANIARRMLEALVGKCGCLLATGAAQSISSSKR
jgi:hypothetical protein